MAYEVKPEKIIKAKSAIGKFGTVETVIELYPSNIHGYYSVQETIKRFEPKRGKGNLLFKAEYFRDENGEKGVFQFSPTRYAHFSEENYLCDWNFRLEFDRNNSDEEFCLARMTNSTTANRIYETIDIYTFGLLVAKFFESCSPHCHYDFKDKFIAVFQNCRYEKLQKFAELSNIDYDRYKRKVAQIKEKKK